MELVTQLYGFYFVTFYIFLFPIYVLFVNAHSRCRTTSPQPITKQQNNNKDNINRKVTGLWNQCADERCSRNIKGKKSF